MAGWINALHSTVRVSESTHIYYKYPARFSPEFASSIITEFSKRGELVVDPFCGGGTTVVEAIRLGRRVWGGDINPLSRFVSLGKVTPLAVHARGQVQSIAKAIARSKASILSVSEPDHYLRHVPPAVRSWAARALTTTNRRAASTKVRRFLRLAILRAAQLKLDSRDALPSESDLQQTLDRVLEEHLRVAEEFCNEVNFVWGRMPRAGVEYRVQAANAARCHRHVLPHRANLILTSPPYAGVHMLYHRWQIQGRRETAFPYLLAGESDGQPESYYTMGARSAAGVENYFRELRGTAEAFKSVLSEKGVLAILVGFSELVDLPDRFLATFIAAGFKELIESQLDRADSWRDVPGRKWFAKQRNQHNASREVLLLFTHA